MAPILKWLIDESHSDYEFEMTSAPGHLFRMTKVAIGEDTLLVVSELSSNNRFTSVMDLLSVYRETKADIVSADIFMPEMDGYALLKQLRKDGFKGPVITATASLESTDKVSIILTIDV